MELATEKQGSADKGAKSFLSRIFGDSKDSINAVDFLKSQHREVEALFAAIEAAGEQAHQTKNALTAKVCEKLTLHTKLEERFLYPTVRILDAKQFYEAEEEHDAAKTVINKLKAAESANADFAAKVKFLKELVEHHVKEEESEMFPLLKKELDHAKLEEIGKKMQDYVDAHKGADEEEKEDRKNGSHSGRKGAIMKMPKVAAAKRAVKAVASKVKAKTAAPRSKSKTSKSSKAKASAKKTTSRSNKTARH